MNDAEDARRKTGYVAIFIIWSLLLGGLMLTIGHDIGESEYDSCMDINAGLVEENIHLRNIISNLRWGLEAYKNNKSVKYFNVPNSTMKIGISGDNINDMKLINK